jgi:CheY-like chemotaxis protein
MPKLLLAEDDEFSRDMLTRRLEKAGYEMIAACDGKEAVLSARLHHPDLILMDLDMPVMDGKSAIRALKSDPHLFKIPVLVLTAHATRHLIERIEELLVKSRHAGVPVFPAPSHAADQPPALATPAQSAAAEPKDPAPSP